MDSEDTTWKDEKLIQTLSDGGVVVMPTDTVYGIVCKATNRTAVNRVYTIRKRDTEKPCIILIGEINDLQKFNLKITQVQRDILSVYWPGPVSVILDCAYEEFSYLHRGTNSLAFRLPRELGLQNLLKQTGPIIAPSANLEGSSVAKNIKEARDYFGNLVDMYIDGGEIISTPSKILKLNPDDSISIIRD